MTKDLKFGQTIDKKHIEPVYVRSCYDTGIPEWYESNGLRFHWFSWLLCEVAMNSGNPVFPVMASGIDGGFGKCIQVPSDKLFIREIWSPSVDDDFPAHRVNLSRAFWYWRPVKVILCDTFGPKWTRLIEEARAR